MPKQIEDEVVEIKTILAVAHATERHVAEIIDRHDTTLFGNGKPGLVTLVDRLDQRKKLRDSILYLLAGAVLSSFVVYVISLLK